MDFEKCGLFNVGLNFKSFLRPAMCLAGIELMHMICKGQMIAAEENSMSFAEQFYALAE
ncbi:MAG: hypothetical protein HHJ12_05740 [Glaciimonas sp.]|nr:hypothetical protein [Glaciimonas sp.]